MRLTSLLALSLVATACGGEPGPAGPAGPQGPAGPSGATLSKTYACTGSATSDLGTFGLVHTVYLMTDGGVMATCNVVDASFWVTGVTMYRSNQSGAAVGGCLVFADIDSTKNAGYWTLETNTQRTSSTATYHNPGSALDNRAFTLSCKEY